MNLQHTHMEFLLGIFIGFTTAMAIVAAYYVRLQVVRGRLVEEADDLLRQRDNWIATAELFINNGEMKKAVIALVKSDKIIMEYHEFMRQKIFNFKIRKVK